MTYSILFVCAFGVITVFCSLVIIIILSKLMSAIVRRLDQSTRAPKTEPEPVAAQAPPPDAVADPQLIAALTAVIADDLNTTFDRVKVTAIRKV